MKKQLTPTWLVNQFKTVLKKELRFIRDMLPYASLAQIAVMLIFVFGVMGLLFGISIGLTALSGLFLMFSWNWFVPALLHGPHLTFIQAWGITILTTVVTNIFSNLFSRRFNATT